MNKTAVEEKRSTLAMNLYHLPGPTMTVEIIYKRSKYRFKHRSCMLRLPDSD